MIVNTSIEFAHDIAISHDDKIDLSLNNISFSRPDVSELEMRRVVDAIDSRWLTAGPIVHDFERRIAHASKCDRAVAYDSCTGAMEMALRVLGIGKGDEIITTPYTYTATAEVIRNVGAKIVFVDLADDSFEMDYDKVAEAVTAKTKAVIPVDIGGKLCDYPTLLSKLGEKKKLFKPANALQESIGRVAVISDSAHSFGAKLSGKVCGEFADFTCFSFHVLKNITTGGEGGAIVWKDFQSIDNDKLESVLRLLGDHGQTTRDKSKGWEYDIELFGYNSIMTNLDAAMGIAQLARLDAINKRRETVTRRYDKLFEGCNTIPLIQHFGSDYKSAMHLYPVKVSEADGERRNRIYFYLRDKGIPCNVHYKPLPMMTAYKNIGYDISNYPNAFRMFSGLLTIPYHSELTEDQQTYVAETIKKAVESV